LQVERRLAEEADRVQHYLQPSTEPLLRSVLDQILIDDTLQSVIGHPSGGLDALVADGAATDLARMYTLFGRVGPGHRQMRDALKAWIVHQGERLQIEGAEGATTTATATGSEGGVGGGGKGKEREADGPQGAPGTQVAVTWVTGVLQLKVQMDRLWNDAFASDRAFQTTINEVRFASRLFYFM
jgi:cullin 3